MSGRTLYIDDFVIADAVRSRGHGALLLAHPRGKAEELGASALGLDSGVQRYDAHRFYRREWLSLAGHHFALNV